MHPTPLVTGTHNLLFFPVFTVLIPAYDLRLEIKFHNHFGLQVLYLTGRLESTSCVKAIR